MSLIRHVITCVSVFACSQLSYAKASLPVDSAESTFGARAFIPLVIDANNGEPDRIVRSVLESTLQGTVNTTVGDSNFVQSSKVELPSGSAVYKYAHYYQGKPVLGDWVMAKVAAGGWIDRVQTRLSLPKLSGTESPSQKWLGMRASKLLTQGVTATGLRVLPQSVEHVWYRQQQALIPAISVTAGQIRNDQPTLFRLVLDASTGDVLQKTSMSEHLTGYKYRIYANGSPLQPFQNPYGYTSPSAQPEPGDPRPTTFVTAQDFTITELSNISIDPWLPDNATETVGNNVDVFFNFTRSPEGVFDFFGDGYGPQYRARGDAFDLDFRAPVNNDNELLFEYDAATYEAGYYQPVDSARDPTADEIERINAEQVNAFYLANFLHDLFYDAGFTESAGNAQSSNFGRGGVEGDPLIIHINSFTFISTPADGQSPVIHLGRSRGGSTALDVTVFAHEWAHYLHRRLVNPTLDFRDNQSRALNEGWADVVGVLMSMKAEDFANAQSPGFKSTYAVGDYFQQDSTRPGFLNPFFYGIRRYPYGEINPFTFEHIAHKAPLPQGFDYSIYSGRGTQNSQIHTAGEVWANTVLACFKEVIASNGGNNFTDTRQTLANITVAAMASTPQNPTFLEARDALLGVLSSDFSIHYESCKQQFAQRGMGSGAVAPPRTSKDFTERVVSFSLDDVNVSIVEANLLEVNGGLDNDGILDATETGVLQLRLRNTGFQPITNAVVELVSDTATYQPIGAQRITVSELPIGADVVINLSVQLTHRRPFDLTEFAVDVIFDGNPLRRTAFFRTHYDVAAAAAGEYIGDNLSVAFDNWQLDRIQEQSFVDSMWQVRNVNNNEVLQIEEPLLGVERPVERALVSPWLTRAAGMLSFEFAHAYDLLGDALVEISTDDETWVPFDPAIPLFENTSTGFPGLVATTLLNTSLIEGQRFKLRFRVNAQAPLTWRLDDLKLTGVQSSPFMTVLPEDGVDNTSLCFPVKAIKGVAVICL